MLLSAAALANGQLAIPSDGTHVLGGDASSPLFVSFTGGLVAGPISAAGTAVTAASETTLLPAGAVVTLPANYWKIGRTLRITASGKISTAITTPGTMRFKVKQSAVAVFDGLAILGDTVAAHSNVGWLLEILLTCRTVGATTAATLWGAGKYTCENILGVAASMPVADAVAVLPWNSTPAAGTGFDSTIANPLDLTFTQTVTTGTITLEQYMVELVGG